ncbi:MAG: hypothetical protein R3323_01450 [Wenzhouxiangellaceae bacterium]|nr:hypothetical protein [Wenzhouxiangellaceae bacterium]
MKIAVLAGLLPALLTGCAALPECEPALDDARHAARQHEPLAAWVDEVEPACRAAATDAWEAVLAAECDPLLAFHLARVDARDRLPGCPGREFAGAAELGAMIRSLQAERDELQRVLTTADGAAERAAWRRLRVIERDLPQLEATARLHGYMAPARAPGD